MSHGAPHPGGIDPAPEPPMHQPHFLLSAAARSLSVRETVELNDIVVNAERTPR